MKAQNDSGSVANHVGAANTDRERQGSANEVLSPGSVWRKKLAWTVAIFLTLASALVFSREAKSNGHLQLEGYGLEGSWINVVSPILPPGAPPITFQTYVTISGGGGWIGSDRTKPFASPQHGTWVHVRGHEYAWTLVQDLFDQTGTFVGTFKARSRIRLVGKDDYIGVANVEQRDASGNIVFARCARQQGTRVNVEPFAAPCLGLEPGM